MIHPDEVQDENQETRMVGFARYIDDDLRRIPLPPDGRTIEVRGYPRDYEVDRLVRFYRANGWHASAGYYGGTIHIRKRRPSLWKRFAQCIAYVREYLAKAVTK